MDLEASRAARAARTARRERERSERLRRHAAIDDADPPPKLGHSLRELGATFASVIHTRIALAGAELEEEIQRLLQAAVLVMVGLVFGFLGIVVATFTIIAAVAPEHRVLTMIVVTAVYLAIGAIAIVRVKTLMSGRPPIFGATFAELEKDKETLTQIVRARRAATTGVHEPQGARG